MPFKAWLQTRDNEYLERHSIPRDPQLWEIGALPQFVEAREELIKRRLRGLNAGAGQIHEERVPREFATGN
jgi:hypothetical protein